MPLARARRGRRGAIGGPVTRTAAVVGTAVVVNMATTGVRIVATTAATGARTAAPGSSGSEPARGRPDQPTVLSGSDTSMAQHRASHVQRIRLGVAASLSCGLSEQAQLAGTLDCAVARRDVATTEPRRLPRRPRETRPGRTAPLEAATTRRARRQVVKWAWLIASAGRPSEGWSAGRDARLPQLVGMWDRPRSRRLIVASSGWPASRSPTTTRRVDGVLGG